MAEKKMVSEKVMRHFCASAFQSSSLSVFILCPQQLLCLVHPVREMTSKEDDSQRLRQGSCFQWVTIAAVATSCPCEVSCVHSLFYMCVPHLGSLQLSTHAIKGADSQLDSSA